MNCKGDHIFDCVTACRNRFMFDSLKKHESPIELLETVTFCEREIFFLMKRTKAEESPCPEFSFLHLRCRERTRERARRGCEAVTVGMKLRLRAPSLFSSVNERKGWGFGPLITQSSRGFRCGYYALLPPVWRTTSPSDSARLAYSSHYHPRAGQGCAKDELQRGMGRSYEMNLNPDADSDDLENKNGYSCLEQGKLRNHYESGISHLCKTVLEPKCWTMNQTQRIKTITLGIDWLGMNQGMNETTWF